LKRTVGLVSIFFLLTFFFLEKNDLQSMIWKDKNLILNSKELKGVLASELFESKWPEVFNHVQGPLSIHYTVNKKLEELIQKKISQYRPEHISAVVIDNSNGAIIAAVDYERKTNTFNHKLAFSNKNPAASVIKIVTSAALMESSLVTMDTPFQFTGRSTTLYKHQLAEGRKRWTKSQTFQKAFASSNNVIFAKAALQNQEQLRLIEMAQKFGFLQELMEEYPLNPSQIQIPETTYNLAELASGLNLTTTLSPVHGAVMASIVANSGRLKLPHLVDSVSSIEDKQVVWTHNPRTDQVLADTTAKNIQNLMHNTVEKGTASRSFKNHQGRLLLKHLEIGGKTGSITGGEPFGKRDWFVAYASPKDTKDPGISICVMIVNVKKWYVKSAFVANDIIWDYFTHIKPHPPLI
jgi:peptidoglycan glycosyltransferase